MLQTLVDLPWAWCELQSVCPGLQPVMEEDSILVVEWVLGRDSTLHSQHTTLALISHRQEDQRGPVRFNRLVDSIFCVHMWKIICLIRLIKGHCALRVCHVDNPIAEGGNCQFWRFPILTWLSLVELRVLGGDPHDKYLKTFYGFQIFETY